MLSDNSEGIAILAYQPVEQTGLPVPAPQQVIQAWQWPVEVVVRPLAITHEVTPSVTVEGHNHAQMIVVRD